MNTGLSWLELLSLCFSAFCLFLFLKDLGRHISMVNAIALITCIIYLVMPVIAYQIYNEYNSMARIFQTVMPITSDVYFGFALPATVSMCIGLNWPLRKRGQLTDHQLLDRAEAFLKGKHFLGHAFIILGLCCGLLTGIVPESIKAILYFGNQLFFVGIFYLLFSPIRYKPIVFMIAVLILFIQTINTGMYGELIFWSLLFLMYMLMKMERIKLVFKVMLVVLGVFAILFIQSIKQEYRAKTWIKNTQTGDVGYFWSLVQERVLSPKTIFEPRRLHTMTTRGNQGFLLARTIDYVPDREPYAGGETILNAVKASLVPRFLWKDKPQLGGLENTCRFLGDCSKRYYSYNIGQMGEAYANFGRTGGIIFMFFYGFFIHWMVHQVRRASVHRPTLILWIPLIFYASLSLETDVLTFLNSFVKGVMFCVAVFLFFKYVFRWRI